jgi:hypothetical protein
MMNLSYAVAVIAGAVMAMSCRYFTASAESARLRSEIFQIQHAADALQVELIEKREQIGGQQEKLSKGSAIAETIGPAVVSDIQASAEKNKNQRLRALLQKRMPQVSAGAVSEIQHAGPNEKKGN